MDFYAEIELHADWTFLGNLLTAEIEKNKGRFLNELFELLKEPSISADPTYAKNVFKTAEMVRDGLKKIGINNTQLFETKGHPIVYGEKIINKTLETINKTFNIKTINQIKIKGIEKTKEKIMEKLIQSEFKDKEKKRTTVGPQADQIQYLINNQEIKNKVNIELVSSERQ